MKKYTITIIILILFVSKLYSHDIEINGIFYNITNDSPPYTVEVTYNTQIGNIQNYIDTLTIPSTIEYNSKTYSVTAIGEWAIYSNTELKHIILPNSITTIGDHAFAVCKSLKSVILPNSVISLGEFAFRSCDSLESIELSNSLTEIKIGTFNYCKNLSNIVLPNLIETIGEIAFKDCSMLSNITFSDNLKIIEMNAFGGCIQLQTIELPDSMHEIKSNAFSNCVSLTKVDFGKYLEVISYGAFGGCNKLTDLIFSDSLKIIQNSAFQNCGSLDTIILPNSLEKIGDDAFKGSGLIHVELSSSITKIGNRAFENIYLLRSLIIPEGIDTIGSYAFAGTSITDIIINKGIHIIENGAFYNCFNLRNVTLGESVTYLGDSVFANCENLTEIILPNSVTYLGRYSFYGCGNLTNATLSENLSVIKSSTFGQCRLLPNIEIPVSVERIEDAAFHHCYKMTKFTFSKKIEYIGNFINVCGNIQQIEIDNENPYYTVINNVLYNKSITNLVCYPSKKNPDTPDSTFVVPETITILSESAFENCNNLKVIRLSKNIVTINSRVFSNNVCFGITHLQEIFYSSILPPSHQDDTYYDVPNNVTILLPCESTISYKYCFDTLTYSPQIIEEYGCDIKVEVHCNIEQGQTIGSGLYNIFENITLIANPKLGYAFEMWSDGVTTNPRSFIVECDSSLTAIFKSTTYLNSVDNNNYISLLSTDIYINCSNEANVFLYNIYGVLISKNKGNCIISVPKKGFYIITIENESFKVFVK